MKFYTYTKTGYDSTTAILAEVQNFGERDYEKALILSTDNESGAVIVNRFLNDGNAKGKKHCNILNGYIVGKYVLPYDFVNGSHLDESFFEYIDNDGNTHKIMRSEFDIIVCDPKQKTK